MDDVRAKLTERSAQPPESGGIKSKSPAERRDAYPRLAQLWFDSGRAMRVLERDDAEFELVARQPRRKQGELPRRARVSQRADDVQNADQWLSVTGATIGERGRTGAPRAGRAASGRIGDPSC